MITLHMADDDNTGMGDEETEETKPAPAGDDAEETEAM